jgi:solute carrier family 13 (sodium-dependent dicarboxylate transporter), member 2/3/5
MIYNDSRRAAILLYRKMKHGWIWATSTFIGNFGLALLAVYFFSSLGYEEEVNYVFFLAVLAIGLWVTESIPPFAVGIFLIASFLLGFGTDILLKNYQSPTEMYLDTWTSNVIWLLLGGFFMAEALSAVKLDRSLFLFCVRRFGHHPEKLLLGLMMTAAVGSMVMSNTATTAMMISSILPLAKKLGKQSPFTRALLVGIPAAATLGGMGTIIGSTPNAIAVGALQEKGIRVSFVDWMAFGLPAALIATWLFWRFLKKNNPLSTVKLELDVEHSSSGVRFFDKAVVLLTLFVTVSMWITEPIHHIPIAATSSIPIVLLTLFQVIRAEHVRRLPWDTLMLVAGGLALGIAMVDVGLTDLMMEAVYQTNIPPAGVAAVFAFLAVWVSNIMSNTAASSILIPFGLSLPGLWGFTMPLVIALSCSCALLFPVSTPSNAIAFSTGMIEQRQFRPGGLYLATVGPILAFAVVLLFVWLTAS